MFVPRRVLARKQLYNPGVTQSTGHKGLDNSQSFSGIKHNSEDTYLRTF